MNPHLIWGLLASRSGNARWTDDAEEPDTHLWAHDPAMLGAVARLTEPERRASEVQLKARARRLLRTQGDRVRGAHKPRHAHCRHRLSNTVKAPRT